MFHTKPYMMSTKLNSASFCYCSPPGDNCGLGPSRQIAKLQNRAPRVITGADYDVRLSEVLNQIRLGKPCAKQTRTKQASIDV